MPTRRVIEIAVDNGLIEPGTISPSYLATRLRDFGLSKAQLQEPSIHNRLQALGPNHVWQLDFTMHSNWKLSNNGFLYREWQGLANRPDDGTEPRLWLAMVTDKATGVYVPFFGRRRGEDTEFALQAFHHAAS